MKVRLPVNLLIALILAFFAFLFFLSLANAIDRSIDNQNRMICNSAKKSRNEQWLAKCQQYYKTGDIIYLRTK